MYKTKNYGELKKKILKDLKNHKPKEHSEKLYHAPKGINSAGKVYESREYRSDE